MLWALSVHTEESWIETDYNYYFLLTKRHNQYEEDDNREA